MIIERTDSEIILRLPLNFNTNGLEKVFRYLKYLESNQDSKAKQRDVDKLADESKKEWWEANKSRFIK